MQLENVYYQSISPTLLMISQPPKHLQFYVGFIPRLQTFAAECRTKNNRRIITLYHQQFVQHQTLESALQAKVKSYCQQVRNLTVHSYLNQKIPRKLAAQSKKIIEVIFKFFSRHCVYLSTYNVQSWNPNIYYSKQQIIKPKGYQQLISQSWDHNRKMDEQYSTNWMGKHGWKFIEQIRFSDRTLRKEGFWHLCEQKLLYLRELHMDDFYHLTNKQMKLLVKAQLPSLQRLDFPSPNVTIEGVKVLLKHSFPKLRSFSTEMGRDMPKLMKMLSQFQVKFLRISFNAPQWAVNKPSYGYYQDAGQTGINICSRVLYVKAIKNKHFFERYAKKSHIRNVNMSHQFNINSFV